jgi:hypothetical protein
MNTTNQPEEEIEFDEVENERYEFFQEVIFSDILESFRSSNLLSLNGILLRLN